METLLLLLFILPLSQSYNVLFANTWHSKSHARTMMFLADRLAQHGHNVSLFSPATSSLGKMGKNIHTLETIVHDPNQKEIVKFVDWLFWNLEMSSLKVFQPHRISREFLEKSLDDATFRDVVSTRFDLVIVDEMFLPGQAALASRLRDTHATRIAVMSTTDFYQVFADYRGHGRNPVTLPNYYSKCYHVMFDPTSFLDRLVNVAEVLVEQVTIGILSDWEMGFAGSLLNTHNTFSTFFQASMLSYVDYMSLYSLPSPRSVDTVFTGEYCSPSKSLPPDMEAFVSDDRSKGTIYVAFGSIVNWKAGPPGVIDTFARVLNKFTDYRVIWSYKGDAIAGLLAHIRLVEWAPQNDILAHNKTKLFFTHGGLKSLKEGICGASPMLFLPFFADQPRMALHAKRLGFAESIYKKNITDEEMMEKMSLVLSNNKYKESVKKVRAQYLDRVMDPLDLGVFWTEKALRYTEEQATRYYKNRGGAQTWREHVYAETAVVAATLIYILCH